MKFAEGQTELLIEAEFCERWPEFKKSGFIEYNSGLTINSSLRSVIETRLR